MLSPFEPVLKFATIKALIFLSFWQGVLLAMLEKAEVIDPIYDSTTGQPVTSAGTVSAGWRNFLVCIEMVFAAIAFRYAFPVDIYKSHCNTDGVGRSVTMQSISHSLKETVNPKDMVTDAFHNFHPQYQQYTQYSASVGSSRYSRNRQVDSATDVDPQTPGPRLVSGGSSNGPTPSQTAVLHASSTVNVVINDPNGTPVVLSTPKMVYGEKSLLLSSDDEFQ
ncbi:hypothetical protein QYM36_008586 [Artemia franciscana]|nr:hypothetical protein QYM36_008586 [Artemia franciscana]